MLRWLGLAFALAVAALLAYVATRPDTFRVERAAAIDAPPEAIYPWLEDFHRWGPWSPYERRDPAMQRSYGGAEKGVGATYQWAGNRDVGKGSMEIIEAKPPTRLRLALDFSEPFEAHNTVTFSLVPEDGATRVTWAMDGRNTFVSKVMGLFLDFDALVGRDFEDGLANLATVAKQ
jgi:uncharacterized protein YndB with AHSA1/START domain